MFWYVIMVGMGNGCNNAYEYKTARTRGEGTKSYKTRTLSVENSAVLLKSTKIFCNNMILSYIDTNNSQSQHLSQQGQSTTQSNWKSTSATDETGHKCSALPVMFVSCKRRKRKVPVFNADHSAGMVPVSGPLPPKYNWTRFVNRPKSVGNGPSILLPERLKDRSVGESCPNSVGSVPEKPPGRKGSDVEHVSLDEREYGNSSAQLTSGNLW